MSDRRDEASGTRGLTRRDLLALGAAGLAVVGCGGGRSRLLQEAVGQEGSAAGAAGCVAARPGRAGAAAPPASPAPLGVQPLGLGGDRDGFLFVPSGYRPDRPAPLLVSLHGAGLEAERALAFSDLFERSGVILLAPSSRLRTWDFVLGERCGADAAFLDRALAQTFGRYAVDPERVALEGFSDGASYALSLGLAQGDLFTHVIAFSPGFVVPVAPRGTPGIFIAHGTRDEILPIDGASRRIVPALRKAGYEVTYKEFDGPHAVAVEIAEEALGWFAGKPGSAPFDRTHSVA